MLLYGQSHAHLTSQAWLSCSCYAVIFNSPLFCPFALAAIAGKLTFVRCTYLLHTVSNQKFPVYQQHFADRHL